MKQDVCPSAPSSRTFWLWHAGAMVHKPLLMLLLMLMLTLTGCGHGMQSAAEATHGEMDRMSASTDEVALQEAARALFMTPASGGAWQVFRLPGKTSAPFQKSQRLGRSALQVQAQRSVSMLRQQFSPAVPLVGTLDFSWKVDALPDGADLKDASATDAPVRILLAFDGDRSKWSERSHRLSELSRLLTGEPMPYATLTYVWSRDDATEAVLHNPRTDRIRKVVVDSGTAHLGQWRDHRRDVRADFIRAFGEEPGPLLGLALMTDTDNTASTLQAWYGALRLVVPEAGH